MTFTKEQTVLKLRDLYKINKGTGKLEPKPAEEKPASIELGRLYLKGMRRMLEGKITQGQFPEWISHRKIRHGVTQ